MSLLLDMMGPAGAFIRKVQAEICEKIEAVMCWATGLLGGSKEACKLGCGGGFRRHLFSSGNETSKFQDIVYHVSRDLDWNGTSNCDMFIHAYKNYIKLLSRQSLAKIVDLYQPVLNIVKSVFKNLIFIWL